MAKIKAAYVTGKSQNRTALGIAAAYLKKYPQSTLDDLNRVFPKAKVNTDCADSNDSIFFTSADIARFMEKDVNWSPIFSNEEEFLVLSNGEKLGFEKMWTASSFDKLKQEAAQYGIYGEVGKVEKTATAGYAIRYEYEAEPVAKKGVPVWIWGVGVLAVAAAAYFAFGGKSETKESAPTQTVQQQVATVSAAVESKISREFNAVQFAKGKADLSEEAKNALGALVVLMKDNPAVRLSVEGHASAEGDASLNDKLAEERAKAVVEFIASQGIDAQRLSYQGFGSSKPKNTANPDVQENRRTEFIVSE